MWVLNAQVRAPLLGFIIRELPEAGGGLEAVYILQLWLNGAGLGPVGCFSYDRHTVESWWVSRFGGWLFGCRLRGDGQRERSAVKLSMAGVVVRLLCWVGGHVRRAAEAVLKRGARQTVHGTTRAKSLANNK